MRNHPKVPKDIEELALVEMWTNEVLAEVYADHDPKPELGHTDPESDLLEVILGTYTFTAGVDHLELGRSRDARGVLFMWQLTSDARPFDALPDEDKLNLPYPPMMDVVTDFVRKHLPTE
jgi:hypothetical protein